jgi:hypothetical protein
LRLPERECCPSGADEHEDQTHAGSLHRPSPAQPLEGVKAVLDVEWDAFEQGAGRVLAA